MKEEVNAKETQHWEKLVKNVLSRETLTASTTGSAITMVAMTVLKTDICDVVLPGLDMF